jgi:hypothetical protein
MSTAGRDLPVDVCLACIGNELNLSQAAPTLVGARVLYSAGPAQGRSWVPSIRVDGVDLDDDAITAAGQNAERAGGPIA